MIRCNTWEDLVWIDPTQNLRRDLSGFSFAIGNIY
jgi:hypothetical protein